jgi:hypothetical protein
MANPQRKMEIEVRACWSVAKNDNDTVVVEVRCERCGNTQSTPMLIGFQHAGPCGRRAEFPSEQIREQYADLREAGHPRVPSYK